MPNVPLISVILPVYNGEEFISEAVGSVVSQTYRNFELLIVDDGSTDRTATIIESFAASDSRIKILTQKNGGVSAARNAGIEIARGDYLTFIDADDALSPDFLHRCIAESNGADIIAADFTRHKDQLSRSQRQAVDLNPIDYLECVLYQRVSSPAVWGKLFRKQLFSETRFWQYRYEDLEIFPKLVLESRNIRLLRENLYYYRDNVNSFINTTSINRFDTLKAVQSILIYCSEQQNMALLKAARCRWLSASFNAFFISDATEEFASFRSEAWNNIREYRKTVFRDRKSPVKIKVGIIASYLGPRFLTFLNRMLKISS